MNEMNKLHEMLLSAHIPHTFMCMDYSFGPDALQIRIYSDNTYTHELDDAVFHRFSHGYSLGLLETWRLSGCDGFETAEQVFKGWKKMFDEFHKRG